MLDCAASCGSDSYVREPDASIDGRRSSLSGPGDVDGRRGPDDPPLIRCDGDVIGVGDGALLVGVSRPRVDCAAVDDDDVRGGGSCAAFVVAVEFDSAGDVELPATGDGG